MENEGKTALMIAAEKGSKEEVAALLAAGADIEERDSSMRTALHWAAAAGNRGAVEALREKGAERDVWDHNGDAPLDLAKDESLRNYISFYSIEDKRFEL